MKNAELIELLSKYPKDMDVRIMVSHTKNVIVPMCDEHLLHTSETARVDTDAPEDEWDCEDGKIVLGNGTQYLLINPIIN